MHQQTRPFHRLTAVLLFALASIAARDAAAQPAPDAPDQVAPIEFADTPFRVPSLGLTMRLPPGVRIDTSSLLGGESAFTIAAPGNEWIIRGLTTHTRDDSLTPQGVAASLVTGLLNPEDVRESLQEWDVNIAGARGRLLDRDEEIVVSDLAATRFYTQVERPGGEQVAIGYTIIWLAPSEFLLFEISTAMEALPTVRPMFEAILDRVEIRDPADADRERADRVAAAERILSTLDRETLTSMLDDEPRFFRLHRPPGEGSESQEVAYQRVVFREGQRGELDPGKAKSRYTAADRESGYLVRIDGRFLDQDRVVDSRSVFFLSFDRTEESWTVRMRVRDSKQREQNWTETGVRLNDSLKVTIDQSGQAPTLAQWRVPPEGYASQVENFLLPRILARFGEPGVFNTYRYHSATSDLTMRTDELAQNDQSGGWTLRTRQHADAPTEVVQLDANGRITQRLLPTGVLVEPSSLEEIARLWRSKGLPFN